jgi:hypothetical protein
MIPPVGLSKVTSLTSIGFFIMLIDGCTAFAQNRWLIFFAMSPAV